MYLTENRNNNKGGNPTYAKAKQYLRNISWRSECVGSFNKGWRILVFYPEPEARDQIY